MNFNVCILSDSSIHTRCYLEIAESVAWALRELGHEAERCDRVLPMRTNIVFGARPEHIKLKFPIGTVLYNGEQVNRSSMFSALEVLYSKYTVWDYSAANAERYRSLGLAVPQVVRPGYAPPLDGLVPEIKKTVDVVFVGSMNGRRRRILDELQDRGLKVMEVPFGVYGIERNKVLAEAKLCINVHYYEHSIFEAVRCSFLAQNGLPVVSEESAGDEGAAWCISCTPYEKLVDVAAHFAQNQDELDMLAICQQAAARQVPLLDDVRAALEHLVLVGQTKKIRRSDEQEATGLTGDLPGVVEQGAMGTLSDETQDGVESRVMEQAITVQPHFPELTLNMIVKNEAGIIERCLSSVKPYLKGWCIVDTGSTDGTQDIIRRCMEGVPGELHERSWKEYDGSRTEAIELARQFTMGSGWLLLIDADEIFQLEGDLVLPDGFDCYDGWISRCLGCVRWGRPLFARANKPWFYDMPRHEGLYCRVHAPSCPTPIANARVISFTDGGRAKEGAHDRFLSDARVLEAWAVKNPGNSRAQYYIAQSYRDASTGISPPDRNAAQKAIMHYLKRAGMAGYPAETFSAMYQAAQCMMACGYPWERVQQQFLTAWNFRPARAEPLYNIARYYREMRQYVLAEMFARRTAALPFVEDVFPDFDRSVYEWRAKEELAVALTYLNGHAEARDINLEIIEKAPPHERERIQANLDMCLREAPL